MHGGGISGVPFGWRWGEPLPRRKLVLISAFTNIIDELLSPKREQRAWCVWVLPLELFERLGAGAGFCGVDAGHISAALMQAGVPREVAGRWPVRVGYNVALKFAERGRIAFALVTGRRDLKRVARLKNGSAYAQCRVEADELLSALRAAGRRHGP